MLPRRKKQTCNYLDDSWGVAPILPAKNIILLCMAFLSKIPPNAPMLQVAWKRVWVPGVCTDGSENANGWCYSGTICLITGSGSLCFRPWPHTSRRTIFWLKYCISPIWIKVLWGGFLSFTTLCFMRSGTVVKTSAAKNDSTPKEHGDMVLVKRNSLCQIKTLIWIPPIRSVGWIPWLISNRNLEHIQNAVYKP